MNFTGRMKVHFNRHGAAPLVWCVSTDAWELAVSEIRFDDCQIKSVYRPKATDDGKPSAWFEVDGTLRVSGSIATISAWEPA